MDTTQKDGKLELVFFNKHKQFKEIWGVYTENLQINIKEHMDELGIETDEMIKCDVNMMTL